MSKWTSVLREHYAVDPINERHVMTEALRTTPRTSNAGGFVGGAGYLFSNLVAGGWGLFENTGRYFQGKFYDVTGNHKMAEYTFAKESFSEKMAREATEEFNPGKGMQFAGAVSQGVGQSLVQFGVSKIPYAGPGLAMGLIGSSSNAAAISNYVRTTGELDSVKAYGYGFTVSGIEVGLEAALGVGMKAGAGKLGTTFIGKLTGKTGTKSVGKAIAGVAKDAFEEGLEEAIAEIADPLLQRAWGMNPDATIDWGQVLYAGAVGAAAGGLLSGAGTAIQTGTAYSRGKSIVANGTADVWTGAAQSAIGRYDSQHYNTKTGNETLIELKKELNAYNANPNKTGTNAMIQLGNIKRYTTALQVSNIVAEASRGFQKMDIKDAEVYASFLSGLVSGVKVNGAELLANKQLDNGMGAADLLAICWFGGAMRGDFERFQAELEAEARNAQGESLGINMEAGAETAAETAPTTEIAGENTEIAGEGTVQGVENVVENVVSAPAAKDKAANSMKGADADSTPAPAATEASEQTDSTPEAQTSATEAENAQEAAEATEDGETVTEEEAKSTREAITRRRKRRKELKEEGAELTEEEKAEVDALLDESAKDSTDEDETDNISAENDQYTDNNSTEDTAEDPAETERGRREAGWYTAEVQDKARSMVRGFDMMHPDTRARILEMIASGQNVDKKTLAALANVIAANFTLHVKFRNDMPTGGFRYRSDNGATMILLSTKATAEVLDHVVLEEVWHGVQGTKLAKDAETLLKRIVGEDAVAAEAKKYRDEFVKHFGEDAANKQLTEDALMDEAYANLFAKYGKEAQFLSRFARIAKGRFARVFGRIADLARTQKAKSELSYRRLMKLYRAYRKAVFSAGIDNVAAIRAVLQRMGEDEEENKGANSMASIGYSFFGRDGVTLKEFESGAYKSTAGYKKYVAECVENMRQTRSDFSESDARAEIESSIEGIVNVAIAAKRAGYDIADSGEQRNARDSKNRLLSTSLEPNSDYFTSNDISTECDKRKNFAEIYDAITAKEEAMGVPEGKRFFKNVDNYFYIHKVLADKGLTTPCRQCYVESMRKNLTPMALAFLTLVKEEDAGNKANVQLYDKGELKRNNAKIREGVRELLTEYGIDPQSLTVEQFTTAKELARMRIERPLLYEAFNSFYGQSKPKMPRKATPFRFGELTALLTDDHGKIKESIVKQINRSGGFRLQSYSDFQIENFVDVLQVIFEAGTLGLSGHAYTKVPAFLKATEGTNLKRNISVFMYNDGGEWIVDQNDSFPGTLDQIYSLVKADDEGNTGIIAVSQNDDMSAFLMVNDQIAYAIPFHKSGIKMGTVRDTDVKTEDGRTVKGYAEIKDHTRQQSEVWAKTTADHKAGTKVGKPINIYDGLWDFENADNLSKKALIEKNVKAYLDACEEAGYLPKFRAYVMDNAAFLKRVLAHAKKLGTVSQDATVEDISFKHKGYTVPYGYEKFLGDYNMFTPDGEAAPAEVLSLKGYDFDAAADFFSDAEKLRRNEILQQFANGKDRAFFRESGLTADQLMQIVEQRRADVVDEILGTGGIRKLLNARRGMNSMAGMETDNEGNLLTAEQREFFEDSKVRDSEGRLGVMYQGAPEEFFAFDKKKSKSSNLYGRGFYFTNSADQARHYGTVRGYYLNITNPLSATKKTISRMQMRKFLNAVAENEDYSIENYGTYDVAEVLRSVYEGKSDFAMLYDVSLTAIGDLVEAVELFNEVNGTEYDGFILDTESVIFRSEQAKLTSNKSPTSNPDIRFSMQGWSEDQYHANALELQKMEPVTSLKGNEFDGEGKLSLRIDDYFNSIGGKVETSLFGTVYLNKASRRSDLGHGKTRRKIQTFPAIPNVLQNGIVIDVRTLPDSDKIIVAAPILLSGKKHYVAAMLLRDVNTQRIYLHDVVEEGEDFNEKEIIALSNKRTLAKKGASESRDDLYTSIILKKALLVKESAKKSSGNNSMQGTEPVTRMNDENMQVTESVTEYTVPAEEVTATQKAYSGWSKLLLVETVREMNPDAAAILQKVQLEIARRLVLKPVTKKNYIRYEIDADAVRDLTKEKAAKVAEEVRLEKEAAPRDYRADVSIAEWKEKGGGVTYATTTVQNAKIHQEGGFYTITGKNGKKYGKYAVTNPDVQVREIKEEQTAQARKPKGDTVKGNTARESEIIALKAELSRDRIYTKAMIAVMAEKIRRSNNLVNEANEKVIEQIFATLNTADEDAVSNAAEDVALLLIGTQFKDVRQSLIDRVADEVEASIQQYGKKTFKAKSEEQIEYLRKRVKELKKSANEAMENAHEYHSAYSDIVIKAHEFRNKYRSIKHSAGSMMGDPVMLQLIEQMGRMARGKYINGASAQSVAELFKQFVTNHVNEVRAYVDVEGLMGDGEIGGVLDTIINSDGRYFTIDEIQAIDTMMKAIFNLYKNYNKVYYQSRHVELDKLAEDGIKQIDAGKAVFLTKDGKPSALLRTLRTLYPMITPTALTRMVEGFAKDGILSGYMQEIVNDADRATALRNEWMYQIDDYIAKHKGFRNKLAKTTVQFKGHEIPLGEAIHLYMLSKREQAAEALAVSAISYRDANGEKQVIKGMEFDSEADNASDVMAQAIKDMQALFSKLYNVFGADTKGFIRVLEQFYELAKAAKKATDIKYLGYTNVIEGYYVPILRAGIQRSTVESAAGLVTNEIQSMHNFRFNKSTVKNRVPLELNDAYDLAANHANGVARYTCMYGSLTSFDRWYNFKVSGNEDIKSVSESAKDVLPQFTTYIRKLLSDVQGIRPNPETLDGFSSFIRGALTTSALGANIATPLKQHAGYFTALPYITMKNLMRGGVKKALKTNMVIVDKQDLDEMMKHSPAAAVRYYKYEDSARARAEANLEKLGRIASKTTILIDRADMAMVMHLWSACKYQIQDDTGHGIDTEENHKLAGELLTKVINETQGTYSAATRTGLQRSRNEFAKAITMFSSDSAKQLTMIAESVFRVVYYRRANAEARKNGTDAPYSAEQIRKAIKDSARATSAVVIGQIAFVLIGMLVNYGLFNKDYGEDEEENKAIALAKTFGKEFGLAMAGIVPVLDDILSFFLDGYEVSSPTFDAVNDVLNAFGGIFNVVSKGCSGERVENHEWRRAIRDIIYSASGFVGLPVRNVYNTFAGIWRRFSEYGKTAEKAFWYGTSSEDLNKAVSSEDEEYAAKVVGLIAKNEQTGEMHKDVANELARLYVGQYVSSGQYRSVVRNVGNTYTDAEGNVTDFTAKERKKVQELYAKADGAVAALIATEQYAALDDDQKADAIGKIYDAYYRMAVAEAVEGKAPDRRACAYALVENESIFFAALAYAVDLKADAKYTKKQKLMQYLSAQDLSRYEKSVILWASGYDSEEVSSYIKSYLRKNGSEEDIAFAKQIGAISA